MSYSGIVVERAAGDRVFCASGVEYTDLFCGCGTVLLGHADPFVTDAVREQLGRVWNTGALRSAARERALDAIARHFPPEYQPVGVYSTGMEVAELALRVARVHSGRPGFIGFAGSMHGKSMATAHLGWHNAGVELPAFHRLQYVPHASEPVALERVAALLDSGSIAAVFVEPFQASAGGHMASRDFFRALASLCRDAGTLLVVDEIFTGFYRTGAAFLHRELGFEPDVVLLGKALGNGFPVSALVTRRSIEITPAMLPSSTFAGNPLAAAAVEATLARMQSLDLSGMVRRIHAVVSRELRAAEEAGASVRGLGALWVIELPSSDEVDRVATILARERILVSTVGSCLRVLPPAIIDIERLRSACRVVADACRQVLRATSGTP